jgi:hypothetical protein
MAIHAMAKFGQGAFYEYLLIDALLRIISTSLPMGGILW